MVRFITVYLKNFSILDLTYKQREKKTVKLEGAGADNNTPARQSA
jgi:hypothetical protein